MDKYLNQLSKTYKNIQEVSEEIINLQAILNLPKGTELFLSDIHGEYEAFIHILNNGSATTSLGNQYYSLGAYDVMYHNDYYKWAKIANSLILRHGMRMYHKDPTFAEPLLQEAYDKPVIDDYMYSGNGGFVLWPQYLGSQFGDQGWSFREHKNLRMGETVFAQMSKPTDSLDNRIFDPRVYVFFDTNNKSQDYPNGAWRAYPQIRDASTPTEGGTPYSSARDNNYAFKGPACLYSPFNFYLILRVYRKYAKNTIRCQYDFIPCGRP